LIDDYKKKAKFGVVFALPKLIGTKLHHLMGKAVKDTDGNGKNYDEWIKAHPEECKPLELEIIAGIHHYLSLE